MIRINLLGRPRPKVKRPVQLKGYYLLIPVAIPLAMALVFGWWRAGSIGAENSQLQADIVRFEQQKREMAAIQAQMLQLEQTKAEAERKLGVIDELERSQEAPRRLLDSVGIAINKSESVWLTSMAERSNSQIEFKGNAGSIEAVANLMTEMERSGYFKEIEIREARQISQTDEEAGGTFEFTLSAAFSLPEPGKEAAPEGQPAQAQPGQPGQAAAQPQAPGGA